MAPSIIRYALIVATAAVALIPQQASSSPLTATITTEQGKAVTTTMMIPTPRPHPRLIIYSGRGTGTRRLMDRFKGGKVHEEGVYMR
ncbi:hypothetical protein FOZ63_002621 [Perkinsus olseni]|uniref:Uncharacterized protein n=1 Tax=Perkinsus olseni TaxID=32597 RepID=A0A7J6SXQ6_PEROL|nr:hypothetical protein FOZ63_002621 [Perkinsus olseni]